MWVKSVFLREVSFSVVFPRAALRICGIKTGWITFSSMYRTNSSGNDGDQ